MFLPLPSSSPATALDILVRLFCFSQSRYSSCSASGRVDRISNEQGHLLRVVDRVGEDGMGQESAGVRPLPGRGSRRGRKTTGWLDRERWGAGRPARWEPGLHIYRRYRPGHAATDWIGGRFRAPAGRPAWRKAGPRWHPGGRWRGLEGALPGPVRSGWPVVPQRQLVRV